MFNQLISLFKPKEKPPVMTKVWKAGMWVVFDTKIAILVDVNTICTIHMVNDKGETTEAKQISIESLRQATYSEIPLVRRGLTLEQAKELGYAA